MIKIKPNIEAENKYYSKMRNVASCGKMFSSFKIFNLEDWSINGIYNFCGQCYQEVKVKL